jgi:hypothetical protein
MSYREYSQEEIEFLKENFKNKTYNELSLLLKRSKSSLYAKCRILNLKKKIFQSRKTPLKKFEDFAVNPNFFIVPNNPEVCYILGLLWGDGYIYKDSIQLGCVRPDIDVFYKTFLKTGNWKIHFQKSDKYREKGTINTNNKIISQFLKDNDYKDKSIKSADKILSSIHNNLQYYFFRGLTDADGSFYFNKRRQFTLYGSYKQDWTFVEKLYKKLNIKYKVSRIITSKGNSSMIRICSKKSILDFGRYIYQNREYDNIGLDRKYMKWKSMFSLDKNDECL